MGLIDLIGNTPIVKLERLTGELYADVYVKLENQNPGGSVKDRLALAMISKAEQDGDLKPGGTIIEPTSGNTGVGLAMISAIKGYKLIVVMPDSLSIERRAILKGYGAEVVLTPGALGMKGAIAKAEEISSTIDGSLIPFQFKNSANAPMHRDTTAQEIWRDLDGEVDIFLAGVGTGGTITGVSQGLKGHKDTILTYAVEPEKSAVMSGSAPGPHKIQGIGAGFIPEVMDMSVVDGVLTIDEESAFRVSRRLAVEEGILCGISSGANVAVALELAAKPENRGKNIVTIICDTGERYLSTALFQ